MRLAFTFLDRYVKRHRKATNVYVFNMLIFDCFILTGAHFTLREIWGKLFIYR